MTRKRVFNRNEFLPAADLAQGLNIQEDWLVPLSKAGVIPGCYMRNGEYLWSLRQLVRWLDKGRWGCGYTWFLGQCAIPESLKLGRKSWVEEVHKMISLGKGEQQNKERQHGV